MSLFPTNQVSHVSILANVTLSSIGILTATGKYIHLSSGGAYVHSSGTILAGNRLMKVSPIDAASYATKRVLVATAAGSINRAIGATKTTVPSTAGGFGELYFRVVAGRPCQIALGTANKKRIKSISPALPASLSISSDGYYITGTPLITGTHNLTVTTDDGSQLTLTIEVLPAGLIPR